MTTGVQNITAEVDVGFTAMTCHFLEGARADGCLVQWRPLDTEAEGPQNGTLLISRSNGSSMATGVVSSLVRNTSYVVEAFSTRGGTPLHEFGIPLQELLTTVGGPPGGTVGGWKLLFNHKHLHRIFCSDSPPSSWSGPGMYEVVY